MKNLAGLMKQAGQMQARMQEMQAKLEAMEVEGQAGAGMVVVVLSGKSEMKRVTIDPKLASPGDLEMLQDLVVAAHTDAKRKIDAVLAEEKEKLMGGIQLPGGMELPF